MKQSIRYPLYPEPGASVLDDYAGLPKLEPPGPLPKGKLSVQELNEWIAYEGLGWCLWAIPPSKIEDKRVRALWLKARDASRNLLEALERPQRRWTKALDLSSIGEEA